MSIEVKKFKLCIGLLKDFNFEDTQQGSKLWSKIRHYLANIRNIWMSLYLPGSIAWTNAKNLPKTNWQQL